MRRKDLKVGDCVLVTWKDESLGTSFIGEITQAGDTLNPEGLRLFIVRRDIDQNCFLCRSEEVQHYEG